MRSRSRGRLQRGGFPSRKSDRRIIGLYGELRKDSLGVAHDFNLPHHIFQLPNIPGPKTFLQKREILRIEPRTRPAQKGRILRQEQLDERRDVFFSLAQRRERNAHSTNLIVEVSPESTSPYFFFQVPGCR